MADLTREQIEYWRDSWAKKDTPIFGADFDELVALCDMALRCARLTQERAELIGDFREAERILKLISELEITESGKYIPNAAAVIKQIAINYFETRDALAKEAKHG